MFTLKIVFVGLIAFAPVDDGEGTFLLGSPRDSFHLPLVVQTKGQCEGDQCAFVGDTSSLPQPTLVAQSHAAIAEAVLADGATDGAMGPRFGPYEGTSFPVLFWLPFELDMRFDDDLGRLFLSSGRPVIDGRPAVVPNNEAESRDVSWIPSVKALTMGATRLRGSCRSNGKSCPMWSGLAVDGGRLSTCHLLHVPDNCIAHEGQLAIYDLKETSQAVGNALQLEVEVEADWIEIVGRKPDGSDVARAKLLPKEGEVKLLVINEPMGSCAQLPNRCQPPTRLGHQKHFYKLLDPWTSVFAYFSSKVPVLEGAYQNGYRGTCEEEVGEIESVIVDHNARALAANAKKGAAAAEISLCVLAFPHGASECDTTTIP